MVDRDRLRPGRTVWAAGARAVVLVSAVVVLSGCGSFFAGLPGIGQPEGTPPRPEVAPEYPHVFRSTAQDAKKPPEDEAKKLEAELARQRTGAVDAKRRSIQQPDKR